MTITYGFFDSISSDRLYNAKQMGSIFDGLILDGVYGGYGDALATIEDSGMDISVGSGRTWFDHTWTYNDAAIGKTIATADALLNRIDIVYLEVNENVGVRANSIDVLTGTPATDPVPPDLTNTSSIHQYALAHIYVGAAVTEIVQANITNMVGTDDTPYVTILVESEDLQGQIWAIVGNIYPPLIDLIELKNHDHSTDTPQVPASGLAANAVETAKIAADAVDNSKLRNSAGLSIIGKASSGSGNPADIVAGTDKHVLRRSGGSVGFGTVDSDGLSAGAVLSDKIAAGAVTGSKMATDSVGSGAITAGAVGSSELAADAVIAGKIANGAVDVASVLASNVVETVKIKNLHVTSGKLATGAVTSSKLGTDAVIAGKIAAGGVAATNELANNIVDDTKVGNRVPQFYRRQGDGGANWAFEGTTNVTPTTVRMQAGSIEWTGGATPSGQKTITFPTAFSNVPLVFAITSHGHADINVAANANPSGAVLYWESLDDANYTSVTLHWLAIGPE
jgi:DNA-binding protein